MIACRYPNQLENGKKFSEMNIGGARLPIEATTTKRLKTSSGGSVDISGSTPQANQILVATSSTNATWQNHVAPAGAATALATNGGPDVVVNAAAGPAGANEILVSTAVDNAEWQPQPAIPSAVWTDSGSIVEPVNTTREVRVDNLITTRGGVSSVSIGNQIADPGTDSVQIGTGHAAGSQNVVIGPGSATVLPTIESIAIGYGAVAQTGDQSVSIGRGAVTAADTAVAIGLNASATTDDTISIGRSAGTGTGAESINIGANANFTGTAGTNVIAIGVEAGKTSLGNNGIAIGKLAAAASTGVDNVCVGYNTQKPSGQVTAIGSMPSNPLLKAGAVKIGYETTITEVGTNSIVIGNDAYSSGGGVVGDEHIILNATGVPITDNTGTMYVKPPPRINGTEYLLGYDPVTFEVSYTLLEDVDVPPAKTVGHVFTVTAPGVADWQANTTVLADGATDVTATAAEVNVLDVSAASPAATSGHVLTSTGTSTAPTWQAPTGGGGGGGGSTMVEKLYTYRNGAYGNAGLTWDVLFNQTPLDEDAAYVAANGQWTPPAGDYWVEVGVVAEDCNDTWSVYLRDGTNDIYHLWSTESGSIAHQSGNSHTFLLTANGSTTYTIRMVSEDAGIDILGNSTDRGTRLRAWKLATSSSMYMPLGELWFQDTASPYVVTLTVQNQWENMRPATMAYEGNAGFQENATNGLLEYLGTATQKFHVAFSASLECSNTSDHYELGLFKNGSLVNGSVVDYDQSTGGDYGSVAFHKIVELATNDTLEMRCRVTTSLTSETMEYANINMVAMGEKMLM